MSRFHPTDILKWWQIAARYPGGRRLFHWVFSRTVPYSATIKAEIVHLQAGHVKTRMRDRRGVRNHLRSIHAIALTNFGELTSGLALLSGIAPTVRGIVVQTKTEYFKKARGTLTSECRLRVPPVSEPRDFQVNADIFDAQGDRVAEFSAIWRLALVE